MTTSLWTADTAAAATQGRLEGAADWQVSGVAIDSRDIAPGDLFVALKDQRDGHAFVASAVEKGAGAALVTHRPEGVPESAPLLVVDDTLEALRMLGTARRAESSARICAITGSAGKTGTKEALARALAPSGATHASAKSFNNHFGVPLTLARMPRDAAFGVFEIGMNHAGEITPLTRMVRPHVAMVTTVQPVHLEFFDSVEGIAEAKAEIFLGLEPGGTALLPIDNAYYPLLDTRARDAGASRRVTFGKAETADLRVLDMTADASGTSVEADLDGTRRRFRLGAPGEHLVMNTLAMLGAVMALDGDLDAAIDTLGSLKAPDGRGARHVIDLPGGALTVVDESYNANPASMEAALATLAMSEPGPGGRRIAVVGDMLELGPDGPRFHGDIAAAAARHGVDLVFCAGPLMAHLWSALDAPRKGAHAPDSRALMGPVLETVRPGDVVMVKGSLGSAMRPIVDELLAKHGQQQGRRETKAGEGQKQPADRRASHSEGA